MSTREERLAELSARAEAERAELAAAVGELRLRIDEKRRRWTSVGFWTGVAVTGATSMYRTLGRNSFSRRVNRWSNLGSLGLAGARLLLRFLR